MQPRRRVLFECTLVSARGADQFPAADAATGIRVPTLFIDAEQEEHGDAGMRGAAAYEVVRQNAPSERRTLPCTHYDIYDTYLDPSAKLATEWFERHL